ncbi:HNH endonuclease signature motif containing protein [Herbiconiux moechotypicola]|uniref:HNH endonuclease signature motif containing protein n=1 Tax=Herbiconiux moechotypicola TaxID=637393 RepID=A0ABN3DYB7_9MICO
MDAILDELVEVASVIAAATARRARLLAEATALRLQQAGTGASGVAMRSLVAEIGCATKTSEGTVLRLVNDAETLVSHLPATLAALSSGTIDYRHAQSMVEHAVSLPQDARATFESRVLPVAESTTPAKFDKHARREREALHPESIEIRAAQAAEGRSVCLESAVDGMAWLVCHLPAVEAVAIDDRLDRIARSRRSAGESRTHAQLRADALAALLLRRSPSAVNRAPQPAGDVGGLGDPGDPGESELLEAADSVVPTVVLTVPVLSMLGHDGGPAELAGHGPIDLPTARRLAARAPSFVRILTDPDTGETLSVGRTRYRPTTDMRLALRLADETCRFPNCTRAAARCELDHTTDWAHGGGTDRGNLHHLCSKHHHLKHDGSGWSVRSRTARSLEWSSPTGRRYTTAPPGRRQEATRRPVFRAESDEPVPGDPVP